MQQHTLARSLWLRPPCQMSSFGSRHETSLSTRRAVEALEGKKESNNYSTRKHRLTATACMRSPNRVQQEALPTLIVTLLTFIMLQTIYNCALLPIPNKDTSLYTSKQNRLTFSCKESAKSTIWPSLRLGARIRSFDLSLFIKLAYANKLGRSSNLTY